MKITIRPKMKAWSAFKLQPELNQEVWVGDSRPRPAVKKRLMNIADDFIERLELTNGEIKDIIITGSLANYNWSAYSDIDLHIILNFEDVDENVDLVKKFFDVLRSNWNKTHDIRVKGHEVEIYVQDDEEAHMSTGVYSLLDDRWLVKPKPVNPEIDVLNVTKKARSLMGEIDKLVLLHRKGAHGRVEEEGEKLKNKLKRMRRSGLESGGIFSVENLAFKVLRRSGHLKKLFDTVRQSYDVGMSLTD